MASPPAEHSPDAWSARWADAIPLHRRPLPKEKETATSMFPIPRRSRSRGRTSAPLKRTLQLELLEMRCVLTGSFDTISLPQGSHGLGTLLLLSDGTVLTHETEQPTGDP